MTRYLLPLLLLLALPAFGQSETTITLASSTAAERKAGKLIRSAVEEETSVERRILSLVAQESEALGAVASIRSDLLPALPNAFPARELPDPIADVYLLDADGEVVRRYNGADELGALVVVGSDASEVTITKASMSPAELKTAKAIRLGVIAETNAEARAAALAMDVARFAARRDAIRSDVLPVLPLLFPARGLPASPTDVAAVYDSDGQLTGITVYGP